MKKQILTFSLALAILPAFGDDISQNLNKLNAAKLLVEEGSKNLSRVSEVQKENASTALGILQSIEIQEDGENFEKTYFAICAKANLILQKYEDVISLWKKVEGKGESVVSEELKYFVACSFFQTGKYDECIELCKGPENEVENKISDFQKQLLASALFKSGKYNEAEIEYEKLFEKNKLSDSMALDYSRILYGQKKYKKAKEVVSGIKTNESYMIQGSCELAQKHFTEAAEFFSKCDKSDLEALFYKAYAEYKNAKYEQSAKDFEKYIADIQNGGKSADACYIVTQCYLFNRNYVKAEEYAKKFLVNSRDENQKEKAVLLLGDIYSDQKKYKDAIDLYKSNSKGRQDFSAKCLYKVAVCYANQEKYEEASQVYAEMYDRFPFSKDAEEALYRSGEVLYMNGKYEKAAPKLKKYYDAYNKGNYTNAAMFYEFDSLIQTGDKAKALLSGNKIVNQYGDSEYVNTVLEKLYEINYSRGDYDAACKAAEKLAEKTGHKDASLENKISYMKKILKGGNKELILAEADYESAGGKATLAGREKGTTLAKLYAADSETKTKAVALAGELLVIQEKDIVNEREFAAVNALIMADYFYEQNRKAEAAEKYLKAAEYSRMNGDGEKAAFSLYTATECFVHLGKKGDANETAALLKNLYPESKYSVAVRSLLK